jgi:diaminopimelate epimerase
MAGGEFCGNGTRSFACLLKKWNPESSNFFFYVSGYPAKVEAHVNYLGEGRYFCEAFFDSMKARVEKKNFKGKSVAVVDMGGIIHIIVEEKAFPFEQVNFSANMKEIKDGLNVDGEAVGVLWVNKEGNKIEMKPVVWVKEIDTCFYETSCGSGSLAVAFANQKSVKVRQPSGKDITINLQENGDIAMSSEMEEINGR